MKIRQYLKESSYISAYWITPTGKVLDCGAKKHIDYVCDVPEKFGLKRQEVEAIYNKYSEPYGFEGKAREDVIIKALEKGFIRLRKYREFWSVNVWNYNRKTAKVLSNWAYELLQSPNPDRYIPVNITSDSGNPPQGLDMVGLSNLHESHEALIFITLNEMENMI